LKGKQDHICVTSILIWSSCLRNLVEFFYFVIYYSPLISAADYPWIILMAYSSSASTSTYPILYKICFIT
jgi:hypothetical protein